jgi:hypothetical protein
MTAPSPGVPPEDQGASFGPGSREPSPSVSAASGFDPSRVIAAKAPYRVFDYQRPRDEDWGALPQTCYMVSSLSLPQHPVALCGPDKEFADALCALMNSRAFLRPQYPLRRCGYCKSWNSKPCGDQCVLSASDPTWEQHNRDSDGSGEAGETGTGSTVGDSAGPKDIAR